MVDCRKLEVHYARGLCPLEALDGIVAQDLQIEEPRADGPGPDSVQRSFAWRPAARFPLPSWLPFVWPRLKSRFLVRRVSRSGSVLRGVANTRRKFRVSVPSQVELVVLEAQVFDARPHCPANTAKRNEKMR